MILNTDIDANHPTLGEKRIVCFQMSTYVRDEIDDMCQDRMILFANNHVPHVVISR